MRYKLTLFKNKSNVGKPLCSFELMRGNVSGIDSSMKDSLDIFLSTAQLTFDEWKKAIVNESLTSPTTLNDGQ